MFFFFFKQKTAYELRISDWSSDVCSSDLVGQQDAGELAVPGPAELQLEIDQPDADPGEKARKEVVDPNRQVREVVQFFLARPAEAGDVLVRNQRIAQRVVLVIIFKDGAREDGAFLHAQPLAQRTGRDIADDDFKRNDLHLPDKLLARSEEHTSELQSLMRIS